MKYSLFKSLFQANVEDRTLNKTYFYCMPFYYGFTLILTSEKIEAIQLKFPQTPSVIIYSNFPIHIPI